MTNQKTNPFLPDPLQDKWALTNWYVNREVEDKIFSYLNTKNPINSSNNFIIMGQGGSGKTTLLNYIQKKVWQENENTKDNKKTYVVVVSITSAHDLRRTLIDIIREYLAIKDTLNSSEYALYQAIRIPSTTKNISLTLLEDFFTTSFDLKMSNDPRKMVQEKDNPDSSSRLVILLDNAHFLLKDRFFKGFITGRGFQSRFSIGMFVTPKAYNDLKSNDPDRVLDRFTLTLAIGKLSLEQTKEVITKRLEYVEESMPKFLSDEQLWTIHSSLNGVPRPIMLACRNLFDIYQHKGSVDDKDIAQALIDVRLETLDYQGIDVETKSILGVFMHKRGIVETSELLLLEIPRASLYIKLNNMVRERMITPCINQETGEKVRGRWQLEPSMSVVLHFGTNGEFAKPYEEQE